MAPRTASHVEVPVGSFVRLERVDWRANRFTVVLALSTECRFCSDNAGLYRNITNALRTNRLGKSVAVLPQEVSNSQAYLSGLKVTPDEIMRVAEGSGVARATPTIIAVGADGRVLKSWVGRLPQPSAEFALREIVAFATRAASCKSCDST
jgi:hypothetical protein